MCRCLEVEGIHAPDLPNSHFLLKTSKFDKLKIAWHLQVIDDLIGKLRGALTALPQGSQVGGACCGLVVIACNACLSSCLPGPVAAIARGKCTLALLLPSLAVTHLLPRQLNAQLLLLRPLCAPS